MRSSHSGQQMAALGHKRKFRADLEACATQRLTRKIDWMSGYFGREFVAHSAAGDL
jgi:hypothetical protein